MPEIDRLQRLTDHVEAMTMAVMSIVAATTDKSILVCAKPYFREIDLSQCDGKCRLCWLNCIDTRWKVIKG